MATIVATLNAASPGTQADNVTTDVNLTYKVYNDTDSYATAEAFGSHVTDADVTVAAGVVTITNVVEPVGVTDYKISSVDEAGNEAVLSNSLGGSIILYEETFNGTTIDASKWDIIDTSANGLASQNDRAQLITDGGGNVPYAELQWDTKTGAEINLTDVSVVAFDFQITNVVLGSWWAKVITTEGAQYTFRRLSGGAANEMTMIIQEPVQGLLNQDVIIPNITSELVSVKFHNNGTETQSYYWDGASWVALGNPFTSTMTGGNYAFSLQLQADASEAKSIYSDNVYLAKENYSTRYPV